MSGETKPRSLSWLRFPLESSVGRRYPELPHLYRNNFQRDRDRVIHTRAFRRLENKTQVFAPGLSDHFRNRLTHTIEVAQIARTLANVLDLNEDLTETLALVHDIGHPPFAHSGEEELNRQMHNFGDSFDHNLHSLLIVESFESPYAMFPGLNLTFEVREGMVKHSRDFEPGEVKEIDAFLPGLRPTLEAQLIDLADEVAYNTADLDDAYAAGLFTIEQIAEAVPEYAHLLEAIRSHYPAAEERVQFHECLRRLINMLVSGLIEGTYAACCDAKLENVDDVRRHPSRLVHFSEPALATNASLKAFLRQHVYFTAELQQERARSVKRIADLFGFYLQHPERLPDHYREQARLRPPHQVVCEYIAGMTDGYCLRLHMELID